MRPISLHLQNFGPYREATLDFTLFDGVPLFLITGKTGSGKTSLFDALCFALYGTTSGELRSGKEMRSTFAGDGLTEVRFTFENGATRYEIVRSPEQVVKKQRGTGVRTVGSKVSLIADVGGKNPRQWTKIQEVASEIQSILGLSLAQFVQIVLLPQGDFRRFLMADSNEKEQVLRTLFHTSFYLQLANKLKEQQKASEQAMREVTLKMSLLWQQLPENFRPESEELAVLAEVTARQTGQVERFAEAFNLAKQQQVQAEKAQQQAEAQLDLRQQVTDLTAQLKALDDQAVEQKGWQADLEHLQRAQEVVPSYEAWQNLVVRGQNLASELQALNVERQQLAATAAELDAQAQVLAAAAPEFAVLTDTVTHLTQERANYARYSTLVALQKQHEATITQLRQKQAADAEKFTVTEETLAKISAQIVDEAQFLAEQQTLFNEKNSLNRRQDQLKKVVQAKSRATELELQLSRLTAEVTESTHALDSDESAFQTAENNYTLQEIARLAATLKPGTPCPLCGATEHPHLVQVEKGELEALNAQKVQAKKALAQAQKAQAATVKAAELQQEAVNDQQALLKELLADQTTAADFASPEKLTAELDNVAARTAELTAKNKHNQALKAQLATEQQRLKELTTLKQTAALAVQQASEEGIKVAIELATLRQHLRPEWLVATDLVAQLEQAEAQLAAHQKEVDTLKNAQANTAQSKLVCQTKTEQLLAQVETVNAQTASAQATLAAALAAAALTEPDFLALKEQLPNIAALKAKLTAFQTQKQALETELAVRQKAVTTTVIDFDGLLLATKDAVTRAKAAEIAYYEEKSQLETVEKIAAQLTTLTSQSQAQLAKLQELSQLAEVANGSGPTKISVERFVLQQSFKEVLATANVKLNDLSQGRYLLVLRGESGSSKKGSGLELDIYDDYIGERRRVQTLSGGESFLCALALSLGLGEVIQNQSGGVEIDLLLIDEGFGSLDEEALATAMAALENLESSGRMIGIISHVKELQTSIPDQLEVVKVGSGVSQLRYVERGTR